MRWVVGIVTIVVVAAVAFTAWPLINLYQLSNAVRSRDTASFNQLVDLQEVRQSIAQQVVDRASKGESEGVKMNVDPAGRQMIANMIAAKLDTLTPEMLFDLLDRGKVGDETAAPPSGSGGGSPAATLPSSLLSRLKGLAFGSLQSFRVSWGDGSEPNDWLTLTLRLRPPVWQLSGVTLPDRVLRRFERDVNIQISGGG